LNLDIGILWIEDSFSGEEKTSLELRVQAAGFVARIDNIANGDELEAIAKVHNLYHKYDLILLDYKLKNSSGDELAPKIRDLFPFTTILFYSGNYEEDDLRKLIAAKRVEGVYCSRRQANRFIERAGSLIDQTAHSLNRLSGMRGLAMRVVAECDSLMQDGVRHMTKTSDSCLEMISEMDEDVFNFYKEKNEQYLVASKGSLDDRMGTFAIDSTKLFKHFRRIVKKALSDAKVLTLTAELRDELRALNKGTAQYDLAVLGKRNILGHAQEVEGEFGWEVHGSQEISTKDFPDLRRAFAEHIDRFRRMLEILKSGQN
jgi:CheY-like chemotaxis protein